MDEKVIEALVTDLMVLYVTVRDQGTSQNSYAEYLCEIISQFDANIKKVRVVKAVSTPIKNKLEKDYGVLLGEATCKGCLNNKMPSLVLSPTTRSGGSVASVICSTNPGLQLQVAIPCNGAAAGTQTTA